MPINTIVNVTITKQTTAPSRIGFGTPMIMSTEAALDSRFPTTAKAYASIAEMGAAGDNFDLAGVTFLMAQAAFAQNPSPDLVIVGKRAETAASGMTVNLVPIVKNSTLYRVTVGGRDGVAEDFDFTSDATATAAEIVTGIVAAINGGTQDVLATDNATDLDVETAATPGGVAGFGKPFTIAFDRSLWTAQNTTVDPGVVTDFNAIRTAGDGNDDFYGVLLDSFGEAEINSLSVAVEATGTPGKIYIPSTFDADVLTSSTTDVASDLQGGTLTRTGLIWHNLPHTGPASGWMGGQLPKDPGSITWKFKPIATVQPSNLTTTELANLENKGANWYNTVAGVNITCNGTMGGGEFIDVTRGIDFIAARIAEAVFGDVANLGKVPFTDPGIAVIESAIRGVLILSVGQGILSADPAPTVTVPLASAVSSADKANRSLTGVTFTGTLAGAIHSVTINGTVVL